MSERTQNKPAAGADLVDELDDELDDDDCAKLTSTSIFVVDEITM